AHALARLPALVCRGAVHPLADGRAPRGGHHGLGRPAVVLERPEQRIAHDGAAHAPFAAAESKVDVAAPEPLVLAVVLGEDAVLELDRVAAGEEPGRVAGGVAGDRAVLERAADHVGEPQAAALIR